jgi:hypothetical protein
MTMTANPQRRGGKRKGGPISSALGLVDRTTGAVVGPLVELGDEAFRGVVGNPRELYLWGYHRITGNWKRLQGPADEDTLKQYQSYFAKYSLSSYYASTPYSGFAGDSRPVYTRFSISNKAPKTSNPNEGEYEALAYSDLKLVGRASGKTEESAAENLVKKLFSGRSTVSTDNVQVYKRVKGSDHLMDQYGGSRLDDLMSRVRRANPKTKLDLILDQVEQGGREITFDTDGWTRDQVGRLIRTAQERGLYAAYDGRFVLVRDLSGMEENPSKLWQRLKRMAGHGSSTWIEYRAVSREADAYKIAGQLEAAGVKHTRIEREGKGDRSTFRVMVLREALRKMGREEAAGPAPKRGGHIQPAALTGVQEDVVSALRNLGDSRERAEEKVRKAWKSGMGFDELFKKTAGGKAMAHNPGPLSVISYKGGKGGKAVAMRKTANEVRNLLKSGQLGDIDDLTVWEAGRQTYPGLGAKEWLSYNDYLRGNPAVSPETSAARVYAVGNNQLLMEATGLTQTEAVALLKRRPMDDMGSHNYIWKSQGTYADSPAWKKVVVRTRAHNPAVSTAQYRMAQAVLSGYSDAMPVDVARELVEKTPAGMRSEFMRQNPRPLISLSGLPWDSQRTVYADGQEIGTIEKQSSGLWRALDIHGNERGNQYTSDWSAARQGLKGLKKKTNPADDSAAMYESFHGSPSTEVVEVEEEEHYHGNLAELGVLVELQVVTVTGLKATLGFESEEAKVADTVLLTSNEGGTQLYFMGGDQELDLAALKLDADKWVKDSMVIGDATHIVYRTEKDFDKFEETDYIHAFSEDTGGPLPELIYDRMNCRLSLSGGQYVIKRPMAGTSPGIEN